MLKIRTNKGYLKIAISIMDNKNFWIGLDILYYDNKTNKYFGGVSSYQIIK